MPVNLFNDREPWENYQNLDSTATPAAYVPLTWPTTDGAKRATVLLAINNDTVAHHIVLAADNSGFGDIGGALIPAASAGVPAVVDLIALIWPTDEPFTWLSNTLGLLNYWTVLEAISAGKGVVLLAQGGVI